MKLALIFWNRLRAGFALTMTSLGWRFSASQTRLWEADRWKLFRLFSLMPRSVDIFCPLPDGLNVTKL